MQLLALTRQNTAGANGIHRQVEFYNPTQHMTWVHPRADAEAVAPSRKTDVLTHDDCEGVSLLDTPAPRKRPPVPTQYEAEPTTAAYQPNGSSRHHGKLGIQSLAQPGTCQLCYFLSCLLAIIACTAVVIIISLCYADVNMKLVGFW